MVPSSGTRPMQQQGHPGLKFVHWTQHRASAIHPGLIALWREIFPPSVLIWMGILWHADGWAVGSSFSFICCLLLYINKLFHNAEMRTNNDARTESMTQSWQAMNESERTESQAMRMTMRMKQWVMTSNEGERTESQAMSLLMISYTFLWGSEHRRFSWY